MLGMLGMLGMRPGNPDHLSNKPRPGLAQHRFPMFDPSDLLKR